MENQIYFITDDELDRRIKNKIIIVTSAKEKKQIVENILKRYAILRKCEKTKNKENIIIIENILKEYVRVKSNISERSDRKIDILKNIYLNPKCTQQTYIDDNYDYTANFYRDKKELLDDLAILLYEIKL